jgi:glycosyltransferase involved in cell wall biosynthesis
MKVLLLSQFFSTTKGGGEYVFSLIAKTLADNGNKVWVITNQIKEETYPIHENIEVIFVPPLLEYKGGLPPGFSDNLRYSWNTIVRGFSLIKKEDIDIIHSNNFAPALAGSVLSTLTGKPHITTIHDVFTLCGKNYWRLWGKQSNTSRINVILAPFFEKLIIKLRYNAIHTVSEATKDDLLKFGAKKPISVIPNAIEISSIQTIKQKNNQFIYIGRLVFYKNLEVVIKAVNIVKKTHPMITLLIVGGGPHMKNLEELVNHLDLQNNVKFSGYVQSDEKFRLLSESQALVFPSLCEGFGLVILEAFEQRKPVLVSNVRPLSDLVSHQETGLVISPHDESEWAKMLIEIIENPQKSIQMGINGREILENKYNIQNMYEKLFFMYSQFLKVKN